MTDETRQELGPAGEHAWQELRLHTEWMQGFWVAWVFSSHLPVIHELEARMEALLAGRGQAQVVLRPRTPEAIRTVLEDILGDATREAHCVWVEAPVDIWMLLGDDQAEPWAEAWDWLMMRANESRGRLEAHLPGGLVFAGSPWLKARAAAAAPDLWSIRALVLEPGAPALGPLQANLLGALAGNMPRLSQQAPDVDLALKQAKRMRAQGHRGAEAVALLRAAEGYLAADRPADAIQCAAEAYEAASGDDTLCARALGLQGLAELQHGDQVAAEKHLAHALELAGEHMDFDAATWRTNYAPLLLKRGAYTQVEEILRPAVDWLRAQLAQEPEDVNALLGFASSLLPLVISLDMQARYEERDTALRDGLVLIGQLARRQKRGFSVYLLALSVLTPLLTAPTKRGFPKLIADELGTAIPKLHAIWEASIENEGKHPSARLLLVHLLATWAKATEDPNLLGVASSIAEKALMRARTQYQANRKDTKSLSSFQQILNAIVVLRRAQGDEAGAQAAEAELAALPAPPPGRS